MPACCEAVSAKSRFIKKDKSECSEKSTKTLKKKMVLIPAGTFMMGSNGDEHTLKRELPQHPVKVNSFYMDETEVTNAEFAEFVAATGYITTAERPVDWEELKKQLPPDTEKPSDEDLQPGSMVFSAPKEVYNLSDYIQWWKWVKGANWKHPSGPESDIKGKENFPVVQISYQDANAYAKWAGKRLPTEAEWEWAARGGLKNQTYTWGNEDPQTGKIRANIWDGEFPISNSQRDGFYDAAPVKSFEPNGYGLYDMSGNVWEMCSDYYSEDYYSTLAGTTADNPKGPEKSVDPNEPYLSKRVMKGGSFLCNSSYCASYRVSARMATSEDSGMTHLGFRLVKDL